MPRYIDAEREIKEIESLLEIKREEGFGEDDPAFYALMRFAEKLRNAPTADVAPVIHAHWIKVPSANYKNIHYYDCSKCKHTIGRERSEDLFRAIEWNGGHDLFCPYCGAKMDEEVV